MIGVGGRLALCALAVSLVVASLVPPAAAAGTDTATGYAIATAAGAVGTFGGAGFDGDLATAAPRSPAVAMTATADGRGYWLAERDGAVLAFGDARHGASSLPGSRTVAIARGGTGGGFYTVTAAGAVRAIDAPAVAAASVPASAGPVVGIAVSGGGVWLATSSGLVAASGPVASVTTPRSVGNVAAIAASGDGGGYWLLTTSGRLVAAGDAHPLPAAPRATSPAVAFAPAPGGRGGLVLRADGSVAAVGRAIAEGDAASPLHPPLYPRAYQLAPTDAVGITYLAPGPQMASSGPWRVTFLGDSLSVILGRYTRQYVAAHHLDGSVAIGGILGCGVVGSLALADYSSRGPLEPTLPACAHWTQQYRRTLALSHPDVVVLLLGFWESQRHRLGRHVVTAISSEAYRRYLAGQLAEVRRLVDASGARLVVLSAPYYGDGTPPANVDAFNALLPAAFPDASSVDLTSLLDPQGHFASVVDGVRVRSSDHVHLTEAGVRRVIDPVLVPLMASEARSVHGSRSGRRSS